MEQPLIHESLRIAGKRTEIYVSGAHPDCLLIQPADLQELALLDQEAGLIASLGSRSFALAAFEVTDWMHELSPWKAAPAFGKQPFGDGAAHTLAFILTDLLPQLRQRISSLPAAPCFLGGYSLAGLFALWAACQTSVFAGINAASPSVWFPGWMDDVQNHPIRARLVYLSLGKLEEHTRNPLLSTVGTCLRQLRQELELQRVDTVLEWNEGNHFKDPPIRTARGFGWLLRHEASRLIPPPKPDPGTT